MYTTPHHLLMALSSLYVYEVSGSPVALVSDPQGPQGGGLGRVRGTACSLFNLSRALSNETIDGGQHKLYAGISYK